ncbi:MAG TPA: methylthioribulose 1-phosphate dehydratase [Oleiagrimonas sp.]|nr:methylthioribulose 1-phosphate dehydratase [Oleiagrimonas sp.]
MSYPDPATCADTIIAHAGELAARGWTPATSGNFSMRVDDQRAAITASGAHKGHLTREDILLIDLVDGSTLDAARRPSAETLLHVQVYRHFPDVGAVLHTHSRNQSVASRVFARDGSIRFHGWELQKAIHGIDSHDVTLELPVFPNSQHMPELAACVEAWLDAGKPLHAYLIEGHGLYAWGRDMDEARRHLDAIDFLLSCELELKRYSS